MTAEFEEERQRLLVESVTAGHDASENTKDLEIASVKSAKLDIHNQPYNLTYLVLFTITVGISSCEYGFVMAAPASA